MAHVLQLAILGNSKVASTLKAMVHCWFAANKLKLNELKTEYMVFTKQLHHTTPAAI